MTTIISRRASALLLTGLAASTLVLGACGDKTAEHTAATAAPAPVSGTTLTLADTTLTSTYDANGVAEPMQQAIVSTKLMGTVTAVLVHEGDAVRSGQVLVQIDARDLNAKANQAAASIADAEAMQREAAAHAARFTALYNDSAATKAQYDAAQTGLARANAGLQAARAGASELEAVRSYAAVRAPFAGIVTMRHADPGTFAAPGAPLVTVQDVSSLRLTVTAPANTIGTLTRGQSIAATVDGRVLQARVEGIVPAGAGNLYTVNAILGNRDGSLRAGSTVTLSLPQGTTTGLVVPLAALVRDGDLVGVIVRANGVDDRRWIRLGTMTATHAEVSAGLKAGETIVIPRAATAPSPKAGT
ncbi:efflux RND transporter periplasmic adaptor subunit [Gemmatimonas sp.]|jgi:RND family efflux transporter MFP subunit|uniref:efflux RND transporter periplasmic adaptor subunit n=1 Tax=Gemmatimonas sp. TaxID=1962908 RepID=UPI0037BE7ED5